MIISELYYFIESLKNIPILSLNALKASLFLIRDTIIFSLFPPI